MAKELVGPIERHAEKVLLGVVGLGLIGVIARFLVTSPNQIEVDGRVERPNTIDNRVLDKAKDVRDRAQRATPDRQTYKPLYAEFVRQLEPFEAHQISLELPVGVSIAPEVPLIDAPTVIEGQAKLVEVVKLPKPAFTLGRTTFDGLGFNRSNWVTVSAVFDREEQTKRQARYSSTREKVVFGPTELQRRVRRAGGDWSEDDWEFVNTYSTVSMPEAPKILLEEDRGEMIVARELQEKTRRFEEALDDPLLQLNLLRPLLPDRMNGDPWRFPLITSYRDVLVQDDDYLHPADVELSEVLDDRYGLEQAAVTVEDADVQLTAAQKIAAAFKEGLRLMAEAETNKSVDQAMKAHNVLREIEKAMQGTSESDKLKAKKLADRAEQLGRDIQRDIQHRRRTGRRIDSTSDDERVKERVLAPTQQVWAHDARPDSIDSGKTYQYRMRIGVYNRLAALPAKFADPQDARVLFVPGEWSEPSDPITIEPDSYFYFTAFDAKKETVSVELYQWFEGHWVNNKSKFKFGIGEEVARQARAAIPTEDGEVDRALVSFAAGATLVDIDFDRPFRERKVRGGGVTLAAPSPTCAIVFVDSNGELHRRLVPTDKGDPTRKEIAARVWKPGKRTRR